MKKFLAVLLTAAMVLCMSMAAFADEEDDAAAAAQTDAVSEAAQTNGADAETESVGTYIPAAEPTGEQEAVIAEILPNLLFYYLDQDVQFADIGIEEVLDSLYGILNDAFWQDSVVVSYTGFTSGSDTPYAFDKVSTLKNVGDIFGRTITEDDITAYNAALGWDLFTLTDDAICINGADGEGVSIPDLVAYSADGDKLTATVLFTTYYDDDSEFPGCAVITFRTNPDSFFGYSLESLISV